MNANVLLNQIKQIGVGLAFIIFLLVFVFAFAAYAPPVGKCFSGIFLPRMATCPYLFWGGGLTGVARHIVWHWDWLKALFGRRLDEMQKKVRVNRIIDQIMWLTFITTNAFGVIAWILHYGEQVYLERMPDRLHVVFGVMCTILMIVHLALHWKWIASSTRRLIQIDVRGLNNIQGQENIQTKS